MSTTVNSRAERKAAATRESIVDAAQKLMRAGGPDAITLPAVSAQADVAVQTVYNRIGGRPELLMQVAERAMRENRAYMDSAYATRGNPLERVLIAGAAYVRFAVERPHEFRLLADPPVPLESVVELVVEQNRKLEGAIAEGISDGSFRADLNPEHTAEILWAMLNGVLALSWRCDRLRTDPDEIMESVTKFVINALVD